MRTLSSTLLAAQKKPRSTPYVEAKVYDYEQGVKRLSWTRVYEGEEPDNHHGIAFDGNGDMHRIRAGPDNKLYYQKQALPFGVPAAFPMTFPFPLVDGPALDQWTEIASDCAGPCAIASYGPKVYIFYRSTNNTLQKYYSHDYGETWTQAQLSTHQNVLCMSATWRGTGNQVVCFAATSIQIIALILNTDTQGLTTSTYNHALDTVYGIGSTYYDGAIPIILAAKDTVEGTVFYSLYATRLSNLNTFMALYPLLTAYEDQNTTFAYPDCHAPASPLDHETLCITAVEAYSGTTAYSRPLFSRLVKGTYWTDATIIEPRFFLPIESEYGLRIQTTADYWWLSMPSGVWQAPRAAGDPLDLTPHILAIHQTINHQTPGHLVIELDNSKAQFASPGQGALASLRFRSEVSLRLGYKTTAGNESIPSVTYWIDGWEYRSDANISTLTLYCVDLWGLATRWAARYVLRWNYTSPPVPCRVWAIIYQLLGRFGIRLENLPVPQSDPLNNFYPKFLIRGGSYGHSQLRRLLSFVTDGLIPREDFAFLKDLRPTESPSYEYRNAPGYHPILKGEYANRIATTHTQVSGETQEQPPTPVREHAFDWENLARGIYHLRMQYDPNLEETDQAAKRAEALLRHESQQTMGDQITVPVNCGQELYDVISVTDTRAGIDAQTYRITAIATAYDKKTSRYEQTLRLAAP